MKLRINKDRILGLIFHPAFLAIIFFFILLIISNHSFSPYKIILKEAERNEISEQKNVFIDINSDSLKERIRGYNLLTNATVIAYTTNESIYEAWNLSGKWLEDEVGFILHDLDQDGRMEMYALTVSTSDSLLINQLVLKRRENIQKAKTVCKLGRFNENLDQDMGLLGFSDINSDRKDELIFYVSSGFTLQPRAFYAWDIQNDEIIRSKYSGINYKTIKQFLFIPGKENSTSRIFAENYATDNYKDDVPFSDTASYAVVLTENLDYLFDPVLMGGPQSNTITYPVFKDGKLMIMAIVNHFRKAYNKVGFRLLNENGEVVQSVDTSLFDDGFVRMMFNDEIILMHDGRETSRLGVINNELRYSEKFIFQDYYFPVGVLNIDNDKYDELIFLNRNKKEIGIMQDDMKTFVSTSIPQIDMASFHPSVKSIHRNGSEIYLQTGNYIMDLSYSKNRLYTYRILFYILIYLLIFSFLFLLQRIFIFTNNRRRIREEKLLNYQLQSVMNQLNPHFTFNAINSIGYAIMEGRKEEAYDYFTKISGLIRKSMKNAFRPYKTLAEEISFVKQYLEIEEYRFTGKLEWIMEVDPKVDLSISVPKMLIHIFVENAIKHGIFHLEGQGKIDIRIVNTGMNTEISIEDNGVGFERTKNLSTSGGKGLIILNNYLEIYNSTMGNKIEYKIEDKNRKDETGTRVRIWIR